MQHSTFCLSYNSPLYKQPSSWAWLFPYVSLFFAPFCVTFPNLWGYVFCPEFGGQSCVIVGKLKVSKSNKNLLMWLCSWTLLLCPHTLLHYNLLCSSLLFCYLIYFISALSILHCINPSQYICFSLRHILYSHSLCFSIPVCQVWHVLGGQMLSYCKVCFGARFGWCWSGASTSIKFTHL